MVRLSTIGFIVALLLFVAPIPPVGMILGALTFVASVAARLLGH